MSGQARARDEEARANPARTDVARVGGEAEADRYLVAAAGASDGVEQSATDIVGLIRRQSCCSCRPNTLQVGRAVDLVELDQRAVDFQRRRLRRRLQRRIRRSKGADDAVDVRHAVMLAANDKDAGVLPVLLDVAQDQQRERRGFCRSRERRVRRGRTSRE